MKIILASASPRRQEILHQMGISFEVMVDDTPELDDETQTPEEIVLSNAEKKCRHVLERLQYTEQGETIVLAADTVVALDGAVMGKPQNVQAAEEMLSSLSGRCHQVYTGVCIARSSANEISTSRLTRFAEATAVTFYPIAAEEIRAYIATGEPFDKAGGYAIQGRAAVFIRAIAGDYWNVVGLPAGRLYQELLALGVPRTAFWPSKAAED